MKIFLAANQPKRYSIGETHLGNRLVGFFRRKRQSYYVDFLIKLLAVAWKEVWFGEIFLKNYWDFVFMDFAA